MYVLCCASGVTENDLVKASKGTAKDWDFSSGTTAIPVTVCLSLNVKSKTILVAVTELVTRITISLNPPDKIEVSSTETIPLSAKFTFAIGLWSLEIRTINNAPVASLRHLLV